MKINKSFILPEWEKKLHTWLELEQGAKSILLNIYKGSTSFANYYKVFRNNPNKNDVKKYLREDEDAILPFTFIANADFKFYKEYFDDKVVNIIFDPLSNISSRAYNLILTTIINNLNDDKNQISEESFRNVFIKHINEFNIGNYTIERLGLFSKNPVRAFAKYCLDNESVPELALKNIGINLPVNSKFLRQTKIEILLNELRGLDYKQDNHYSRTIIQQNLHNLEYKSMDLTGHEIIRIILSSNLSVDIHKNWTQLILSIASDPRSSKESRSYQKWWSRIEQNLIDRFIRILSHSEILLFLDAISEYADSQNSEMSRMFESRKQLLVGLSIQNKIEKSRLFLPKNVSKSLRKENPKLDLSYICNLQGEKNKCIIYLKIGDNHIIEGSHNCKIRLYTKFNSQNVLLNPNLKEIFYSKITTGIEHYYRNNGEKPLSLVHHPSGIWKKKIIDVLRKSIDFEVDQLLTKQEINYYRY